MRILGIDPGLRRCGWGVVETDGCKVRWVAHGDVRPPTTGDMASRLAFLFAGLEKILDEHRPDAAAVEETFVNANPASALKLGQARAACLIAPARRGLPVAEYAPSVIKKAVVGNGAAEKAQVATMISIILPGAKAVADAADALAIAICHAHHAPSRGRGVRSAA